jgi:large subunit ribosomal protein L22
MVAKAQTKYIRISPRKLRGVVPLIKGIPVEEALSVLKATNKKGAYYLEKTLKSAVANAKNKGFSQERLTVSSVIVNPGPAFRRYRAASFGRAEIRRKRTSHIKIGLDSSQDLEIDLKATTTKGQKG